MKQTILILLVILFIFMFANGSVEQVQESSPEIEFVTYEEQQCPRLKSAEDDEIIRVINAEIEAQFQLFLNLIDGKGSNSAIHTWISSTDTTISILLKAEYEYIYGTDGEVWGICYDYINKTIVPCGADWAELKYSFSDVYKEVAAAYKNSVF